MEQNTTVTLEEWVALSALLEGMQLQDASRRDDDNDDANNGHNNRNNNGNRNNSSVPAAHGTKLEAKLAYAERACKVALLLLHRLMANTTDDRDHHHDAGGSQSNNGAAPQVAQDHLSVGNISVKFSHSNNNQGAETTTVDFQAAMGRALRCINAFKSNNNSGNNGSSVNIRSIVGEAELKCILEDSVMDVVSTVDSAVLTGDIFYKLGIILYQLFARGESLQQALQNKSNPSTSPNKEIMSIGRKDQKDDPAYAQEDVGAMEKEERSDASPRKQAHLSNITITESLSEKGVPESLCRIVADLINPNEHDGTPFESLSEIVEELKQILERPDVFFYDVNWLDFSSGLIGRSEEMQRIHQVAASVQLDAGEFVNQLVLLNGFPGSGKSYLASNVQGELAESGWLYVHTKFDRFVQNPLLTIASSFDELLTSLGDDDEENMAILNDLEAELSASAIVTLSEWLPSLHELFPHILRRVISNEDLSSLATENNERRNRRNDITSNSESAKGRLHYIFRKLVSAISSPDRPLLIFLDDLQWADESCLDLISSLLMDFNHIDQFGLANDNPQCFLVMGSYRANEVDSAYKLSSYLETFERSNTLQVTNIQLDDGIAKPDTNLMISEMLGLPLRLTKSLNDAVHAKTLGNPLYIHAFMQSLVQDKLLVNSVAKKRWVWDIDAIKSVSIQGSIVEVLTRKISYLPHDTQDALKVMSTFGSQISEEYIQHLYPLQEKQREFLHRLDSAVEENVIEKIGHKYKFVHDMIQQAVYELMSPQERGQCHFNNGVQMISQLSTCTCEDSHSNLGLIAFAAIDQINIATSFGITDTSMHNKFATLNLKAGERSMSRFNFISALSYFVHGLSFLPKESRWSSSNYDLSRSLHEAACLACYINALPAKANEYISELLDNGQCLEHKLMAYNVMVKNLVSSGDNKQAVQKGLVILTELGETFRCSAGTCGVACFPADFSREVIQQELSNTKALLNNVTKDSILSSPKLTDEKKIWAMRFMNNMSGVLTIQKPQMLPLIACRMVQRSSEYGYCSESAFGIYGYGRAQISVFEDVDEGYRWGKISLSLLESLEGGKIYLPKMRCLFYSYVSFWKEPFQASSNILLQTHTEAMMVGDVEYASISAFFYCRQCLVCGQNLQLAEKECKAIMSKMVQMKQIQMCYGQVNTYLFVLKMNGNYGTVNPFPEIFGDKITNEEELLQFALESGKQINSKGILSNRCQIAFWLGRYEEAAELSEKAKPLPKMSFMEVYHIFCDGLTAFQLARVSSASNASKWMALGEEATARFRFYEQCSKWNWENNLFLLEAECHRCNLEEDKAKAKYESSIKSAQDHRFVHEEGLALEFYGDFLLSIRKTEEAKERYASARVCYEKWGAHAIISRVEEKIGRTAPTTS